MVVLVPSNAIEIWDVAGHAPQKTIDLKEYNLESESAGIVTYDPKGTNIAVSFLTKKGGLICFFELNNCKLTQKILLPNFDDVDSLRYSLDGSLLAVVYEDENKIEIWDILLSQSLIIKTFASILDIQWIESIKSGIYSLTSIDKEGIKLWQIIRNGKQIKYRLAWSSHPSRHFNVRNLNISRATGLSKINEDLLKQRSESTLEGELSTVLSSIVLAARNKQKHIESGVQKVSRSNSTFSLDKNFWLVSLVREYTIREGKKHLTAHTYLIIQGIDDNGYTVIKEIDLVLKNKQFNFFELIGSAKIRVHDCSLWDLKEKENNLESISRKILRSEAEDLIAKAYARMASAAGTGYLATGKAPRLFDVPWQNCLSFCLEMLKEAQVPIEPQEKNWTSFFCVFPSDYIPDPVVASETKENCLVC